MSLEHPLENRANVKIDSGKQLSLVSSDTPKNDNLYFGSWEVGLEELNCERIGDFLPILLGIKGAMPPILIPLDGVGGPLPWAPKIPENSLGQSLEKDNHSGPQAS